MINDAKTCNCTTNDSNSILQKTDTMLSRLRGLTECLHNIESKINRISNTMFFEMNKEMNKERVYTEPKDMNTEIIHNHEVALAIIDALSLLEKGIGIDQ